MKKQSSSPTQGMLKRLPLKAALRYSFIFVLCYLLAGKQSAASANIPVELTDTSYHFTALISADVADSYANPFSNPFRAASVPDKPEGSDENDTNDNPDNEAMLPSYIFSGVEVSDGNGRNLFDHLAQSSQNRAAVSLFILHHSWKSFLV